MNNKGFTLVEMLATIVILGLIMGIASYGVISAINTSKKKSEGVFVERFSTVIDEYLTLSGYKLNKFGSEIDFKKCYVTNCYDDISGTYIDGRYDDATISELISINVSNLKTEGLLSDEDAINPANKKKCFNGIDPLIRVFKDNDSVYYYYVDLSGSNTTCEISSDNSIINTLPDNFIIDLSEENCSSLSTEWKEFRNKLIDETTVIKPEEKVGKKCV